MDHFPLKITWNLDELLLSTTKDKRTISDGRRGRDTVAKNPPLTWQHTIGRDLTKQASLPEEQGFGVQYLGPQTLGAAPERQPPKHLA